MTFIRRYFIPNILFIAALFAVFYLVNTAFVFAQVIAQTAPPESLLTQLIPLVITALVPLLIALTKNFLPLIPSWVLPILAPILGIVLTWIQTMVPGAGGNVIVGAVMGGLGVWLREVIDQLKKRLSASSAAA
jgi:hypothetical protein